MCIIRARGFDGHAVHFSTGSICGGKPGCLRLDDASLVQPHNVTGKAVRYGGDAVLEVRLAEGNGSIFGARYRAQPSGFTLALPPSRRWSSTI